MAEILETIMLICFGLSWPINLVKNIKAQTAASTSLKFLILITVGYIAGIAAKFAAHKFNYVLIAYFVNLAFVAVNIVVYFINSKKDKKRKTENENINRLG